MDQHDLDAIIKHLQADPVVKASAPPLRELMRALQPTHVRRTS